MFPRLPSIRQLHVRRAGGDEAGEEQEAQLQQPAGNANTASGSQSPSRTQSQLPTTLGPLTGATYELPIRTPAVGEEQIQGLLIKVDCSAREIVFTIQSNERTLRLSTPTLNGVHFTTYTPDVSGEITCGARNPGSAVVVTFRPPKDSRAKFNGALVAVEFVPKEFELKKR